MSGKERERERERESTRKKAERVVQEEIEILHTPAVSGQGCVAPTGIIRH